MNAPTMLRAAVSLTDDEHMQPARIARVAYVLRDWLATSETLPAPAVAIEPGQLRAMAAIVVAELEVRLQSIWLLEARTPAARLRARDDLGAAAMRLRTSVDHLLDVEAFRDGATASQLLSPSDR